MTIKPSILRHVGALAAIAILASWGGSYKSRAEAEVQSSLSGDLTVLSAKKITNQDLIRGTVASTLAVELRTAGSNLGNVAVHVELLKDGVIVNQAEYDGQDILHDSARTYWLDAGTMPEGIYTLAVAVFNADGSPLASFGNLGSVAVSAAGAEGAI